MHTTQMRWCTHHKRSSLVKLANKRTLVYHSTTATDRKSSTKHLKEAHPNTRKPTPTTAVHRRFQSQTTLVNTKKQRQIWRRVTEISTAHQHARTEIVSVAAAALLAEHKQCDSGNELALSPARPRTLYSVGTAPAATFSEKAALDREVAVMASTTALRLPTTQISCYCRTNASRIFSPRRASKWRRISAGLSNSIGSI